MTTRRTFILTTLAALLATFAFCPAGAWAQDSSKAELQKRFKQRDGEIRKLKSAGTIGETDDGFVALVASAGDGDGGDASKVVDEENADRRKLYAIIAKEEKTSPEAVGKVNAKRNFDRARPGEYLKTDGKWKKKGE
jgi:uncharacterized protein YdbL (DUF1318 family)